MQYNIPQHTLDRMIYEDRVINKLHSQSEEPSTFCRRIHCNEAGSLRPHRSL
ncbi:hypothetical protein DPMN_068579 [Dreissena polymorpha]|uniref:Uncharacterized protein n=1 Tax=Dreissena polymorpha TaxID=45954 RepID=A0A9D3YXD9_DREPO|nr:hypothetical protein DPMN_068579 [Dreissena polymorpha]